MHRNILLLIFSGLLIASCSPNLENITTSSSATAEYEMISITELQKFFDSEDFTFINVHIPLEGNIPGTDLEIPYDEIQYYTDQLPEDKNNRIVIYCRSGSMGHEASEKLVEMGYSNVYNLEGGYAAWRNAGFSFGE